MANKKLLDNPDTCVQDMLEGLKLCYPALIVNPGMGLTLLNKDRGNKVALISGGGSGHEPFPAGYIANNMLTGSTSGLVFTSPPVSNIFSAIQYVSNYNKGGVLVIIMNYSGDQLNFGLAIEHAKSEGIQVESISVKDDCGLLGLEANSIVGNRGICGCALVFKILGAMSDAGHSLKELITEYDEIQLRLASMGACLYPCTLPHSDHPLFNLGDDEVSLGCGVHGEAGIATIKISSLKDTVSRLLTNIFETGILKYGEHVSLLIGNLGAATEMECLIVAKETQRQLNKKGITVDRAYVGTVMSSLDMKGVQISMLNTTGKTNWLDYLDLPTEAFGWPGTQLSCPQNDSVPHIEFAPESVKLEIPQFILSDKDAGMFQRSVISACRDLIKNKDKINELDSECGDGDCGSTLERLATGIIDRKDRLKWNNVGQTLMDFSCVAECEMGGTSGAVYSLMFQGAAKSATSWHSAWSAAMNTLYKYSPARVGHRSMVDALAPACDAYTSYITTHGEDHWLEALKIATRKAEEGCQSTIKMKPMVGRASYAERARIKSMDAGAYGVIVWLNAIAKTLNEYGKS